MAYKELKQIFTNIEEFGFEIANTDGRVGIARLAGGSVRVSQI